MSKPQAQWIDLSENPIFSGGYIDNVQQVDMPGNYSPYLRNARFDGNSIAIRPGHVLLTDQLTAGDYPRGIGSYLRSNPANDVMVVRHNISGTQKLYTLTTDGTLTAITTGANIASDNRMTFTNVGDVIYCMNGSDDFGKLSGTTYSTPSTGVANFAPSFSVVFNGSHFASGWSTNSNIVYKSVGDNYEDFSSTGSDTLTFEEIITGLAVSDQALFYFTRNTVSLTGESDLIDVGGTLSYNTRPLSVIEGSVNHKSIKSRGNKVFYVTPSNQIMFVEPGRQFNGKDSIPLSHRENEGISKLMSTLDDDQSDCWAYGLPGENIIKWFFKSKGSSFHDVCIVYDKIRDKFLPDTNKYFYDGVVFKNKYYTLSELEPKVFRDEYAHDDEDAPIPFEYRTKEFYVGGATWKNVMRGIRNLVDFNRLVNITVEVYIDGSLYDTKNIVGSTIISSEGGIGTYEIGSVAIGTGGEEDEMESDMTEYDIIRTKGDMNVKGKKIQVRWKNTTVGGKLRLKTLDIEAEKLPELANNN